MTAILDAAGELLIAQGPNACTTNRVAERAGVSIGSLYRYFDDKHAIFLALRDRLNLDFTTALRTAVEQKSACDPTTLAKHMLHTTVATASRNAALFHALTVRYPQLGMIGLECSRPPEGDPSVTLTAILGRQNVLAEGWAAEPVAATTWAMIRGVLSVRLTADKSAEDRTAAGEIEDDLLTMLRGYWAKVRSPASPPLTT